MKFFLGSSSPRRKDLLESIGLAFEVIKPEVEELHRPGESPQDYVERNARTKGRWVRDCSPAAQLQSDFLVISADTIVTIDGKILEKPVDHDDARRMLELLSGRRHQVLTGVGLLEGRGSRREVIYTETTEVEFRKLTAQEISSYIRSGEPLDKAGSYAAQGRGSYMVHAIHGSYSNVVGLPTSSLVAQLQDHFGLQIF